MVESEPEKKEARKPGEPRKIDPDPARVLMREQQRRFAADTRVIELEAVCDQLAEELNASEDTVAQLEQQVADLTAELEALRGSKE